MDTKFKPNKRMRVEDGLLTIGWGPFKYQWYSICSAHRDFDDECDCCVAGSWINCWGHEVSSFVYENNPQLWQWWVNRPRLVPSGVQLLKDFISGK